MAMVTMQMALVPELRCSAGLSGAGVLLATAFDRDL